MRVLLDTHVFLWWVEGDRALPAKARAALADRENECLISLASAWELALKAGLGKLKLALPVKRYVVEQVAANGFRMLDIQMAHVGRVETLAPHQAAEGVEQKSLRLKMPLQVAEAICQPGRSREWFAGRACGRWRNPDRG